VGTVSYIQLRRYGKEERSVLGSAAADETSMMASRATKVVRMIAILLDVW